MSSLNLSRPAMYYQENPWASHLDTNPPLVVPYCQVWSAWTLPRVIQDRVYPATHVSNRSGGFRDSTMGNRGMSTERRDQPSPRTIIRKMILFPITKLFLTPPGRSSSQKG